MTILVKRTQGSSYFPQNFEALEKTCLESLPHVHYYGVEDKLPSEGSICLITNTHTQLKQWETLRPRVRLLLHPNSGQDNLVPGWPEVPLIVGNTIRAQAVAEWCMAALFQHSSWIRHHSTWPSSRNWARPLLTERSTLIVGHGHVGKLLAQALPNANIHDPALGLHADLKAGWQTLILVASLNEENHHLLDEQFFTHCPTDFLLINPARGELVEEKSLRNFLASHPLARAYLDVHQKEPFSPLHWNIPQVTATPHIAGVWHGLIDAILEFERLQLKNFITGKHP